MPDRRIQPSSRRIRALVDGRTIVDTTNAVRVDEAGHAPVYYVPRADVAPDALVPAQDARTTTCPWKGAAAYFDVLAGDRRIPRGAWSYPEPLPEAEALRDRVAFYPHDLDECWVGDRRARPEANRYLGGWVTDTG